MPFPDELYYNQAGSGKCYTSEPTAEPDFDRAINNKADCFISISSSIDKKPKKIIFYDWTCKNWNAEKIKAVECCLEDLRQQGFELYFCNEEECTPITKDNWNTLDYPQLLEEPKKIIARAIKLQKNLTQDTIFLMDSYWLERILKPHTKELKHRLRLSDFLELHSDERQKIVAILKKAKPPPEELLVDIYSIKASRILALLQRHFPDCQLVPFIEKMRLTHPVDAAEYHIFKPYCDKQKDCLHLKNLKITNSVNITLEQLINLLNRYPNIKELDLDGDDNLSNYSPFYLELNHLTQLKQLDVTNSHIHENILIDLLNKMPNLECLNLGHCKGINNHFWDLFLKTKRLKLKKIDTTDTNLNSIQLQTLLEQNTSLEKLSIGRKNLSDNFARLPANMSLITLKNVCAPDSDITSTDLASLLEKTPNLQELDVKGCNNIQGGFARFLARTNLPGLKRLYASNSNLNDIDLNALLQKAPDLETLDLNHCKQMSGNFSLLLERKTLNKLKEIYLSKSKLSAISLIALLEKAQNIEYLNLSHCKNIGGGFDAFKQSLLSLKNLDASYSNITAADIKALLEKAPNLRYLELNSVPVGGCFAHPPLALSVPNLTHLIASYSDITATDVLTLLKKTANLQSLTLYHCQNLNDDSTTIPVNTALKKLKLLTLGNSNITGENLVHLLNSTPNLETVYLDYCINISTSFASPLMHVNLEKLRKVYASGANLTSFDLIALLQKAPNLEELNLSACKNIKNGFANLPINSQFTKLKNLDASCTDVCVEDICTLLEKAPNIHKIILYNCMELTNLLDALDPNLRLPKLKHLYINTVELDEAHLAKLHSIAPNLKNCDSLNGNIQNKVRTVTGSRTIVDADTTLYPNKKFKLSRIFYSADNGEHPEVSDYRLETFNAFDLNSDYCTQNNAFSIYNKNNLDLVECNPERLSQDLFQQLKTVQTTPNYSLKYGKQNLYLNSNWQAIASLSAQEEMLAFRTTPVDTDIQLAYSVRDNLYYIRSLSGSPHINFEWSLKVPTTLQTLPASLQKMVRDFLNFGCGTISLNNPDKARGKDYLDAILKDRKGSCRHRTLAFMAEIKKKFPDIPARIVNNDCHSFIEVQIKGEWIACNLGGYPIPLEITSQMPGLKPEITKDSLTSMGIIEHSDALSFANTQNPYDQVMETWIHTTNHKQQDPENYYQELLKPGDSTKKILIELTSPSAVSAMVLSLQKHCQQNNRPVFYINSPSDVSCTGDFLQRIDNVGTITKGPGGPLYEFLKKSYPQDNPPIILVNYANFSPSQTVALNTLLDKERRIDGIAVPDNALIIGSINTEAPDVYGGSDFYSRFDRRDHEPVSDSIWNEILNKLPIATKTAQEKNTFVINLYHASDWKSQLLGRWTMTSEGLRFEEGILKKAIASKKPIEIQNGLWEDPEFTFFWQHALILGEIHHYDETISTQGVRLVTREGYSWGKLKKHCQIHQTVHPVDAVLNPGKLNEFFGIYEYQKTLKTLVKTSGHIEQAAKAHKKSLNVLLTRSISSDDWARLLNLCEQYRMTLQIQLAAGVTIPKVLLGTSCIPTVSKTTSQVEIIQTSDVDISISMLTESAPDRIVIDVSECKPSDLFIKTSPHYNKKKLKLEFTQQKCALIKALEAGKEIILTGTISGEIADALAPLILNLQNNPQKSKGKLIIVSKNVDHLRFASCMTEHKTHTAGDPASILRTRAQFKDSWRGFTHLEYDPKCLGTFNPNTSQEETRAFNAYRNKRIFKVLNKSPYVFITGLSGVGKSTFIEKEFMKGVTHKIYRGEKTMEHWALDKSDCPKFLFIDEANFSQNQWSQMESLFYNKPPSILIQGQLRTLSSQHKIIFAGNPLNYGDERTLAPFFIRHGRAVVFDPLPIPVIFEQILKPSFEHTVLSSQAAKLCAPIFDIYAFLCAQSTTDILISPRELHMMALLTVSYCKQIRNASPEQVVKHYAYELAKPLVPENKLELFEQQFGKKAPPLTKLSLPLAAINADPAFMATPSRLPVLNTVHELLLLREMRTLPGQNEAQKFGGLGGVILEGESSVGKSAMVLALLRAHGFEEEHSLHAPSNKEKPFYRMDLTLSLADKEKLLLKAFHEGAVVVIDEINSSPMMERLLNDLLMGKSPNPKIKPKPGFMVIGTQNPVTMSGRRRQSTALSRRLCLLNLAPYPREELLQIIVGTKQYPPKAMQEFSLIIDAFLRQSAEARQHLYTPAPTLRQVQNAAELVKKRYPALQNPKSNTATLRSLFAGLFFKWSKPPEQEEPSQAIKLK